ARRNTKIQQDRWEKYYNKRRQEVDVKVKDLKLIEVKRRPHGRCKWRKRPIPVTLPSGPGTRKMTRREAADERQKFAVMEMKTVISSILRSYTIESLDSRDKVLPLMQITLHPSEPIRMRIRPRRMNNMELT
ncbi:hypothetical protein NPIL_468551, partial [Nephila pilipes]